MYYYGWVVSFVHPNETEQKFEGTFCTVDKAKEIAKAKKEAGFTKVHILHLVLDNTIQV